MSKKHTKRPIDRKALVHTWIQDELHRFEIKQEEKASNLAREINDQTSHAVTYSQDFAPSVRLVIDRRGSNRVESGRATGKGKPERPAYSALTRGTVKTAARVQSGRPSGASSHLRAMPTASGDGQPSNSRLSSAVQPYVGAARTRRSNNQLAQSHQVGRTYQQNAHTTDHMLLLRSQNQLVPEDFRRLMLVKSPRDKGQAAPGKPPILSDNFSKINVKQAVAMSALGRDVTKTSGIGPLLVSTGGPLSLRPSHGPHVSIGQAMPQTAGGVRGSARDSHLDDMVAQARIANSAAITKRPRSGYRLTSDRV